MPSYTTAEIDANIVALEIQMKTVSEEVGFEGRHVKYGTVSEIRNKISYWESKYPSATDAPATITPKTRTLFYYGTKGF